MDLIVRGVNVKAHIIKGRSARIVTAKFLNKNEVELRVPARMGEAELQLFLTKHNTWLERVYKKQSLRKPVFHNSRVLLNGEYLKVEYVENTVHKIELIGSSLFVHSPDILALKDMISRWIEEKTREYLKEKEHIFRQYGVREVAVKASKTRWGYCTSKRKIAFNPFLASLPERLREYLIFHEIAHLYELNHSWRYKAKLEELIPDYKAREKELKGYVIS